MLLICAADSPFLSIFAVAYAAFSLFYFAPLPLPINCSVSSPRRRNFSLPQPPSYSTIASFTMSLLSRLRMLIKRSVSSRRCCPYCSCSDFMSLNLAFTLQDSIHITLVALFHYLLSFYRKVASICHPFFRCLYCSLFLCRVDYTNFFPNLPLPYFLFF